MHNRFAIRLDGYYLSGFPVPRLEFTPYSASTFSNESTAARALDEYVNQNPELKEHLKRCVIVPVRIEVVG